LTKSPRGGREVPQTLDGPGPSVPVMDIVAVVLAVLTFVALLLAIEGLDRV